MELFGAWECGPVPWDFAAFVRFWFPSTRGYLVVVSSLSLDWKDWGEKHRDRLHRRPAMQSMQFTPRLVDWDFKFAIGTPIVWG
jgi:hypothetical protein